MPEYKTSPGVVTGVANMNRQIEAITPADTKEQLYVRETVQLLEVKKALDEYIQQQNLSGDLNTMLTGDGLMLRIQDSALFSSGSAELLPEARRLAGEIAKLLIKVPQKVTIAGHTDTVPINTAEFPTNWELSSKRALNFMRFILSEQPQLDPIRFNATGYGEYRPASPNNSPENRAKNRRVEVLILRQYKQ
jgi:chemotaxis protein MotB